MEKKFSCGFALKKYAINMRMLMCVSKNYKKNEFDAIVEKNCDDTTLYHSSS